MKDKWEKGEPVNLSDLLKITPVANEIMRLSDELNMESEDIMWIVNEIIRDSENEEITDQPEEPADFELDSDDSPGSFEEDWELEDEDEDKEGTYRVYLKIVSRGKYPEVSFKAGVNDREDVKGFLQMVIELISKMDI